MPVYRSRSVQNKKNMHANGGAGRGRNRRSALVVILNIVLALTTALFIGACFAFARVHLEEKHVIYFADRYIFRTVERHEYATLVDNYYYDHIDLLGVDPAYEEAAAIAEYAEAAFRYSGYAATGDAAAADKQKEIMAQSRTKVSTYLPELDRIDKMAGIAK